MDLGDVYSIVVPLPNNFYAVDMDLFGQYTVTCPNNIVATVSLSRSSNSSVFSDSLQFSTTGGVMSFTTLENAKFMIGTDSGSYTSILLSKTGNALVNITGTLDTITTTGTYSLPGPVPSSPIQAQVLIIGGGTGGTSSPAPGSTPGPGGQGGGVKILNYNNFPTSPFPVVIGAGGPANSAGGVSIFGTASSNPALGGAGGVTLGSGPPQAGQGISGSMSPLAMSIRLISRQPSDPAGPVPYPGSVGKGGNLAAGGTSGVGPPGAKGGGGGGGGVPGSTATPGHPGGPSVGGAGGDGRIFILRFNS